MKNTWIILFAFLLSCNQHDNKKNIDDSTAQIDSMITNEEKYAIIEALFSEHTGFDSLNFNYHYDNNYIQILATSDNIDIKEFDYIEELFWWNNSSYFNDFLIQKIKNKLNKTEKQLQKDSKKESKPMIVKVESIRDDSSKC